MLTEKPTAPAISPNEFNLNLHFKGFAGGVPQNTETSTEKYLWLQDSESETAMVFVLCCK